MMRITRQTVADKTLRVSLDGFLSNGHWLVRCQDVPAIEKIAHAAKDAAAVPEDAPSLSWLAATCAAYPWADVRGMDSFGGIAIRPAHEDRATPYVVTRLILNTDPPSLVAVSATGDLVGLDARYTALLDIAPGQTLLRPGGNAALWHPVTHACLMPRRMDRDDLAPFALKRALIPALFPTPEPVEPEAEPVAAEAV